MKDNNDVKDGHLKKEYYAAYATSIHVTNSRNIRFRNLHIYSDSKAVFDASVRDDSSDTTNRELEIASLTIPEHTPAITATAKPMQATRVTGGFFNPSSATVNSKGQLYFVDTVKQHIFRYLPEDKRLETVRDTPIDAANLFFDKSDNLLAVSYAGTGTVYVIKPDASSSDIDILKPQPAMPRPASFPSSPSTTGASTTSKARTSAAPSHGNTSRPMARPSCLPETTSSAAHCTTASRWPMSCAPSR